MQKINKQNLGGGLEDAKLLAEYTWKKDEVAWYFCTAHNDVFQVRFTGNNWLSGNKWGRDKIYQYTYLASSGSHDLKRKGLNNDGISHGDENEFFTTKQEAIESGLRFINNNLNSALDEYRQYSTKLMNYSLIEENKPKIDLSILPY